MQSGCSFLRDNLNFIYLYIKLVQQVLSLQADLQYIDICNFVIMFKLIYPVFFRYMSLIKILKDILTY